MDLPASFQGWKMITGLMIKMALALSFDPLLADRLPGVPRGPDVSVEAGNCAIGPFGSTGSAGVYDGICHRLSLNEKCLAYLKQHFDLKGEMIKAVDSAKAEFCIGTLRSRWI